MEEYKRTRMVGPWSKKERKQETTQRGRKDDSPENLKILKFKNSGNRNLCFSNSNYYKNWREPAPARQGPRILDSLIETLETSSIRLQPARA